jgi:hypothetical protein
MAKWKAINLRGTGVRTGALGGDVPLQKVELA